MDPISLPLDTTADPKFITNMLNIYQAVRASGKANHLHARISLSRGLNIPAWRHLTEHYHDKQLVDMLEFGFPLGYVGPIPTPCYENHMSARCYPDHVQMYLDTETHNHAMMGPFTQLPFTWAQVSPLMSRPKKGTTPGARRIIVDLSHPPMASVNHFTPRDTYCGKPSRVSLPSVDDLIHLINQAGPTCYLYSTDIARAYRNLPLDPLSWPLTCIQHAGSLYCDISLPFGARWSAHACQRTTDAIRHIMTINGHTVLNYIDDICGVASSKEGAEAGFKLLQATLADLGLPEATDKACPPTRVITWLGVEFDCDSSMIKIPHHKLEEIQELVKRWQHKQHATLRHLRSLLGKLLHICQCCPPARLFLNRMLQLLRDNQHATAQIKLDTDFQKDLSWFHSYIAQCNGQFMMPPPIPACNAIMADACLSGGGAIYKDNCYFTQFPDFVMNQDLSICHKEALNCLISIKLWAPLLANSDVTLYCDSMVTITTLATARGRDPFLLSVAREVWLISARYCIHIRPCHKPGADMEGGADALSRYHTSNKYQTIVHKLIQDCNFKVWNVDPYLFKLQTDL